MGITGLLPFLEKSSKKTNIKEFSGGVVAIDTYCWLHKGVYSCAEKLMMGQTTNAYVVYCTKYINMLLKYNIKPILVFDGRQLPAKEHTEIKRRESRQLNRRKGIELIQMGKAKEGRNLLIRAIDITHEIALELIKYCHSENIDCIVAPYEADAQLAYLNIKGIADVVITEDSDLTLFGCKKIFFKMDFNGNGVLIEQDRLHLAMDMQPEQFDMDKFRYICILSGCDYLPSLPGIGLGKARKFIAKNTDDNIHRALTRVGSVLNMKSLVVTQEYRDAFILADITFKHQLVFCPLQRKQVRLNPPSADITEEQLQYAGKELHVDLALQLALGNCDPSNLKMLHDFNPDKIERKQNPSVKAGRTSMNYISIWSGKYKTRNHTSSSEKTVDSTSTQIATEKQLVLQDASKNVPLKLNKRLTVRCDNFSENLDENILDMYNCQDTKLVSPERSSEQESEQLLYFESKTSPELFRQRNPFVKQVTDLTTSPSVLSSGNWRSKGRNLMRIRRTIIDENTIVASRYFSKENEAHGILALQNNDKSATLQNAKCNVITDMNTDVCADKVNREQLQVLSTRSFTENASSKEDISDALLTKRNECWDFVNSHEDIPEKIHFNNRLTRASPTTHCPKVSEDYILDNSLVSNSSVDDNNDSINYENVDSAQEGLFKQSIIRGCETPTRKRLDNFRKRSSSNLMSQSNSVTKRARQNKHSPVSQQSLLSMYGFKKGPSLKH